MSGAPRYTVLYEVESLEVLASAAYLQRLNNPTPWTSKTMPHYRGMSRGLCSVEGSWGFGMGQFALLVRFKADDESKARAWLAGQLLPGLTTRPGLGSAHLLKGALAAAMTAEQKIRGADAGVDWAILATGYELAAVEALASGDLAIEPLREHGVSSLTAAVYQAAYSLSADEMDAGSNPA